METFEFHTITMILGCKPVVDWKSCHIRRWPSENAAGHSIETKMALKGSLPDRSFERPQSMTVQARVLEVRSNE
jgi:hypothetical protein